LDFAAGHFGLAGFEEQASKRRELVMGVLVRFGSVLQSKLYPRFLGAVAGCFLIHSLFLFSNNALFDISFHSFRSRIEA
jgi:hypothetical protein